MSAETRDEPYYVVNDEARERRAELKALLDAHPEKGAAYVRKIAGYARVDDAYRRVPKWDLAGAIGTLLDDPKPFKELIASIKLRPGEQIGFDADLIRERAESRAPF